MNLRSYTRQSRLPPELIDRIIDHLQDSPADLRTCARVCKAWLQSSRLHLFYSVTIHSARKQKTSMLSRCQRLYSLFKRCPLVALNVRELHVELGCHCYRPGNSTWLRVEKILPSLLQSFTRLYKLGIREVIWASLTPNSRKSLRDLVTLPSLVHLEVISANFYHFTSLLRPSLKQLSLSASWHELGASRTLDADCEQRSLSEQEPCRLETLTLSGMFEPYSSRFIDWLLGAQSVIDISNLHTLSAWCCPSYDRYDVMRLVRNLGSSLEHLTFQQGTGFLWYDPLADKIRLGVQHKLRTLTFCVRFDPETTALFFTRALSSLTAPSLESIFLKLRVWNATRTWLHWRGFDRALDQAFSSLRSVEVLVKSNDSMETLDAFCRGFTDQFPSMMKRGLLKVQIQQIDLP